MATKPPTIAPSARVWIASLPGAGLPGAGLLLVGLLLASLLAGCGLSDSAKYGNRRVRGLVLPVSAGQDVRRPDLLITNWAPIRDEDTFYLTYAVWDGDRWNVRWEREIQEFDYWYYPLAVFDAERAYYVAGTSLLALNRADGSTTWQTPLSDLVTYSCQNCLQIVGNQVVVLTTDYVLQGLDAAGGELLWSARLNDAATARDGFTTVDEQIVLLDRIAPDSYVEAIHIFDPASGNLVRQVAPVCSDTEDRADLEEAVIVPPTSPSGGRAIILNDCGFDPYAQGWNLITGQMLWQQALPKDMGTNVNDMLLGEERLYLDTYAGLWAVSMADGQVQMLVQEIDPDYAWLPIDEREGVIFAWARRTRGSSRYELWALDASGRRIWQHEMPGDSLLGVDPGTPDWTYRFTPRGLLLIQILDDPEQVLLEVLEPQTGEVTDRTAVEVENASLDGVAWRGYYGYLTIDGDLYELDLETSTLTAGWP